MFVFALAEHLHKTVAELGTITREELALWAAYFEVKKEQEGT